MLNKINILDHGFVRLVDHMGDDARIVQSARVSYGKGTKTLREDQQLIKYLYTNKHTSPFEQVIFTFHIKLPIFVARQWIRHRTARVNEISGRYSEYTPDFYIPDLDRIREQDYINRQGSGKELHVDIQKRAIELISEECYRIYDKYKKLLEMGVSREVARIILPLNIYTEWYWQMDLHNLMHFLKLRLEEKAQWEIRQYARAILDIIKEIVPMSYDVFCKEEAIFP